MSASFVISHYCCYSSSSLKQLLSDPSVLPVLSFIRLSAMPACAVVTVHDNTIHASRPLCFSSSRSLANCSAAHNVTTGTLQCHALATSTLARRLSRRPQHPQAQPRPASLDQRQLIDRDLSVRRLRARREAGFHNTPAAGALRKSVYAQVSSIVLYTWSRSAGRVVVTFL